MQKILFPMPTMNITTGVNMGSHLGSNAIDCAGEDTGIDNVYAPFTGTIKKIYQPGNTVWLESNEPVLFADGTAGFATASFTHDNNVSNLSVGQVIQQGQVFYQEGTAGNATGNHLHLEIGKGRFMGTGWYKNGNGNWVINNSYEPWNAFWLDNVRIINGRGYNWRTVNNDGGNGMPAKVTVDTWRQLSHGILGRNGLSGRKSSLDGSMDGEGHVGRDLTPAYLQELFLSAEGRQWRDSNDDNSINGINRRLNEPPKEIVVEKPVEVIKEVIKEVPVEKVVTVEKIVEVVKDDKDRTFGDLLAAALKKLFNTK